MLLWQSCPTQPLCPPRSAPQTPGVTACWSRSLSPHSAAIWQQSLFGQTSHWTALYLLPAPARVQCVAVPCLTSRGRLCTGFCFSPWPLYSTLSTAARGTLLRRVSSGHAFPPAASHLTREKSQPCPDCTACRPRIQAPLVFLSSASRFLSVAHATVPDSPLCLHPRACAVAVSLLLCGPCLHLSACQGHLTKSSGCLYEIIFCAIICCTSCIICLMCFHA